MNKKSCYCSTNKNKDIIIIMKTTVPRVVPCVRVRVGGRARPSAYVTHGARACPSLPEL